jgi:hypothetical protein
MTELEKNVHEYIKEHMKPHMGNILNMLKKSLPDIPDSMLPPELKEKMMKEIDNKIKDNSGEPEEVDTPELQSAKNMLNKLWDMS